MKWWDALSRGSKLFVGGALAAIALWLLWAFVLIRLVLWFWTGSWTPNGTSADLAQLGQVGDLFGGVNALFAALAFVGVAIAAYYQNKTFSLQAEQHVRQAFEPLFFQLLQGHQAPKNLSIVDVRGNFYDTREFARSMASMRLAMDEAIVIAQDGDRTKPKDLRVIGRLYQAFYLANDGELAPYFRKLYHLFKFIAHSDLKWDEKVRYANIARAALNKDELLLLALNCMSEAGAEFKSLVEGLGLLKHMPDDGSLEREVASSFYSETAFMPSRDRARFWMYKPTERPHWAKDAPI